MYFGSYFKKNIIKSLIIILPVLVLIIIISLLEVSKNTQKDLMKVMDNLESSLNERFDILNSITTYLKKRIINTNDYSNIVITKILKEAFTEGYDLNSLKQIKLSGAYWLSVSNSKLLSRYGEVSGKTIPNEVLEEVRLNPDKTVISNISERVNSGLRISRGCINKEGEYVGSLHLEQYGTVINQLIADNVNKKLEYVLIDSNKKQLLYTSMNIKEHINTLGLSNYNFTVKNPYLIYKRNLSFDNNFAAILAYNLNYFISDFVLSFLCNIFYLICFSGVIIISYKIFYNSINKKISNFYKDKVEAQNDEIITLKKINFELLESNKAIKNNSEINDIAYNYKERFISKCLSNCMLNLTFINETTEIFIKSLNKNSNINLASSKQMMLHQNIISSLKNIFIPNIEYEKEEINIIELLETSVNPFSNIINEKNIKIINDIPNDLSGIFINKWSLELLLTTLLSYSLNNLCNGCQINIKLSKVINNDLELLSIEVSDNGFGINNDDISNKLLNIRDSLNAFELFIPKSNELEEIIKKVGGNFKMQKEIYKGSTYSVIIPTTYQEKKNDKTSVKINHNEFKAPNITYLFKNETVD